MISNFYNVLFEVRDTYKKYIDYGKFIILGVSLMYFYMYFQSQNIMERPILILLVCGIGIFTYVSPWVGFLLFAFVHCFALIFVNVTLAFLYLCLYATCLFFGLGYYKNDMVYLSILYMLALSTNPLLFAIAIVLFTILCSQRGFGFPSFIALMIGATGWSQSIIGNTPMVNGSVFDPTIDTMEQVKALLFDTSAYGVLFDLMKENGMYIAVIVIVLYLWFRLLASQKVKDKLDEEKEIKKSVKTAIITIVLLILVYVFNTTMYQVSISSISIFQYIIGGILAFLISLFIKRYPLSETLSHKEVLKEKEMSNLEEVLKVEKNTSDTSWDDIAGYEDVKTELKEVLEPYLNKSVMKKMSENKINPIKGLLLFGAPGTGKTMFARAIANESKMPIITVAGAEFTSKWVGESDQNLRNIFQKAREKAPCIIFFDELESFLPKRETAMHSWERTLVTTFLAQMDGFKKMNNILIIGATNYPDQIDPAAIRAGRFDKCIYIEEPNVNAKMEIIRHYLGERNFMENEELREVALKLERYTAADIEGLIKEMYRQNHYEAIDAKQIIEASKQYKPTITLDMRDHYDKLAKQYNRRFIKTENEDENEKKKANTWDDIAGMEDVKKQIRNHVEKPLLYADKYEEIGLDIPKGALMFGPPGCGKTLFAKVIASECNASFKVVNGPELLSGKIGESEEKLRRVFRDAREQKPSIIFFDEFDSIAENRNRNSSGVKLINQLLTEMDGMEELKQVIVLAATNRIEDIDPALKRSGRFDSIIYVGLPDKESRRKQFSYHLKQVENIDFDRLAQLSHNFTCADIEGCCNRVKTKILDQMIGVENQGISQDLCEEIVEQYHPTLNEQEIAYYEQQRAVQR